MGLLDAATDRAIAESDARVVAVQVGTVMAHDKKAAQRWQRKRSRGSAMSAAALEGAIAGLARQHPEYVVMGA